ncbi:hypothetical protein JHK86_004156 [Glycine max]|nr:hypothetical protein JHK86_004156 [Glycine max]
MQSFGDVASMTDCGILDQTLVSVQTFIAWGTRKKYANGSLGWSHAQSRKIMVH